jgi:hypothetical protein
LQAVGTGRDPIIPQSEQNHDRYPQAAAVFANCCGTFGIHIAQLAPACTRYSVQSPERRRGRTVAYMRVLSQHTLDVGRLNTRAS